MYKCANFSIEELISKNLFNKIKAMGLSPEYAWRLFSPDALKLIDKIRDYYDTKIFINTWKWDGELNYCGYREDGCPIGTWTSMHRRGCAFDLHFDNVDTWYKFKDDKLGAYDAIRQDMLRHKDALFPELTGLEANDGIARIHVEGGTNRRMILFEG